MKIILSICLVLVSSISIAGVGTGDFKIVHVSLWSDGSFKIYTDSSLVNGLEGCTATDKSIGVPASYVAKNQALSLALTGKTTGALMRSWVSGCCMTHNGLTSPCLGTLTY